MRTVIPADLHAALSHLAVDRSATIGDLLVEAIALLLRQHEKADPDAGEATERAAVEGRHDD